jgi:hypothetical protein
LANETQKYDDNISAMEKYLYKEIEEVRKDEKEAETPQQKAGVLERKRQLLSEFEEIQVFEKLLERSPSLLRLAFNIAIFIFLGITLNAQNLTVNISAILVFFMRSGYVLVDMGFYVYRCARVSQGHGS